MWEANILYGRGRAEEVRALAKDAQQKGQEVGYVLLVGMMRLDGNKQDFEDMAVEYAVQTGNSPPVWLDEHERKQSAPEAQSKRMAVEVAGLTSEAVIETTIKMETPWAMSLDFSKVSKIDGMGLEIFHQALSDRIQRRESTRLIKIDRVLGHLIPKLKAGAYGSATALWLLCFNCLRLTGGREQFDDLVADFVEHTGEDMPVWADLRDQDEIVKNEGAAQAALPVMAVDHTMKEALGELKPDLFKELAGGGKFAQRRAAGGLFVIDFTAVRRWSIEEMWLVSQFVSLCHKEHLKLEFRHVNEILLSLMKAFALDKHVKLIVAGGAT